MPPTTAGNALLNTALVNKRPEDVDSLVEVNALIEAVNAITALAAGNGSGLKGTTEQAQVADLQAKLELLGLRHLDPATMAAVQAAIVTSADDGSGVDSVSELQALADKAQAAQRDISAYADTNAGTPPTAAQYADMGVTGIAPDSMVLLDAVNAALASVPVTRDKADSPQEVQAIVDAYARILTAADGGANLAPVLPTAADYAAVGVSPAPAADSPALSLLNQVVDKAQTSAVSTPAALNVLAGNVARLMDLAAGKAVTPTVSRAELEALGLTGLTDHALVAVLKAIEASADNGSGIDTLSELQALANNAKASLAAIENFAQNNSGTPPTAADYRNIGLVSTAPDGTITPLVTPSNLGAINSALATTPITADSVNTPDKLATLINAYNAVIAAADGGADLPADGSLSSAAQALSPETFAALGVTGVTPALLAALQYVVDAMPAETAKNAANLQASINAITKIFALADGKTTDMAGNTPAEAVTAADITAAGVTLTNATTASAVSSALDGLTFSQVNTPAKLQAVVDAYAKILAEANEPEPLAGVGYSNKNSIPDTTTSDPLASDYAAIGASLPGITAMLSTGVDLENLSLLNDALKRKSATQVCAWPAMLT